MTERRCSSRQHPPSLAVDLIVRTWPQLVPETGAGPPSHATLCARRAVTGPQVWAVCLVRPQGVRFEGGHYVCLLSLFIHQVVSDSATPWMAACQDSLSLTISQSLPKFMLIESVMPFNHPILSRPQSPFGWQGDQTSPS